MEKNHWTTWNQLDAEWDQMYNSLADADKDAGGAIWGRIHSHYQTFGTIAKCARRQISAAATERVRDWLERVAVEAERLATIYHLAD